MDLVVFIEHEEAMLLMAFRDKYEVQEVELKEYGAKTIQMRFGRLNLICISDPILYSAWRLATSTAVTEAKEHGPLDRELAVCLFNSVRRSCGCYDARPTVGDARAELEGIEMHRDEEVGF